jgi:hypothetical protein
MHKLPANAFYLVLLVVTLALPIWGADPPLWSNLIEGSIVRWQYTDNPNPGAHFTTMWLLVKMDDGRTVGVTSQRIRPPTEGERVLVQERTGLLAHPQILRDPQGLMSWRPCRAAVSVSFSKH